MPKDVLLPDLPGNPESVPKEVRRRIAKTLRENSGISTLPESLNISPIRLSHPAISGLPYREAYAFSVRGDVPDAYFDEKGEMIASISGLIAFDAESDESRFIAVSSMRMAGISEKKENGKNAWFRLNSDGTEERLEAFGTEAFELWNEVRFFENRMDFLRRLRTAKMGDRKHFPFSSAAISEYVGSGAVTIAEFLELKRLGGVSDADYRKHAKTLASAYSKQAQDPKFDRPLKIRSKEGIEWTVFPVSSGIDENAIRWLVESGGISSKDAKMALESLRTKESFRKSFLGISADTSAKTRNMMRELSGNAGRNP